MTDTAPLPHELLDDGFAPPACDVLVLGCGNILRGDDALGPRLVRLLWQEGVPQGVRLADGGTAGMDVAFQMRGAARVVIVDAAATGAAPGTVYRVPGEELADLPPASGIHTHSFRWDHALAFARWLLGPHCPSDVTVFLVEVADVTHGADLSAPAQAGLETVAAMVRAEFFPAVEETVEISEEGYLHLDAALVERYFPAGVVGALVEQDAVLLIPIRSAANGGHLLKHRNPQGDRSLLMREFLDGDPVPGVVGVDWDVARGALRVPLTG
ncbi:hydrogenase maturation protease [Nocardioides humi]|uniref:Hydrogenase maturation protease n=1 Tax=Nocardioides humi TaxID=449461 RepID=A0ABN2A1Z2_9ACTN